MSNQDLNNNINEMPIVNDNGEHLSSAQVHNGSIDSDYEECINAFEKCKEVIPYLREEDKGEFANYIYRGLFFASKLANSNCKKLMNPKKLKVLMEETNLTLEMMIKKN